MADKKIKNNLYCKKAFTLIEITVAIAIISLLITISVISFNASRARARDATRIADIELIATALEMYYNDHRTYPQCWWCCESLTNTSAWETCLEPALSPYLKNLPSDPLIKEGRVYCYSYNMTYRSPIPSVSLIFALEQPNPNISNASFSWGYSGYYPVWKTISTYCKNQYCT